MEGGVYLAVLENFSGGGGGDIYLSSPGSPREQG